VKIKIEKIGFGQYSCRHKFATQKKIAFKAWVFGYNAFFKVEASVNCYLQTFFSDGGQRRKNCLPLSFTSTIT